MQRHGIPAQDVVNAELVKMAADLHLPLVATNDAHYLEGDDHEPHDVLLCIGTAANLDDPKRFRFDGHGFYVKDGDEMWEVFHDHPSAVEATLEIAERCDLELEMGKYHLPEFQVPAGTTREQVLEEQAWTGLRAAPRARPRRTAAGQVRRLRRAHEVRALGDPVDGVRRLLPDRLGLHRLRAPHRRSGGTGPRLVGRDRWSPTASASPVSTRSSTTSSSSAS